MAKAKSKVKRKSPVERVRVTQQTSVIFPARNCSGNEANVKAVHDGTVIKFYEPSGYGDGSFSSEPIGTGVRLDVLKAVVEKFEENA